MLAIGQQLVQNRQTAPLRLDIVHAIGRQREVGVIAVRNVALLLARYQVVKSR